MYIIYSQTTQKKTVCVYVCMYKGWGRQRKQMWQNVKNQWIWVWAHKNSLYYYCNFSVSMKLFQGLIKKQSPKTNHPLQQNQHTHTFFLNYSILFNMPFKNKWALAYQAQGFVFFVSLFLFIYLQEIQTQILKVWRCRRQASSHFN